MRTQLFWNTYKLRVYVVRINSLLPYLCCTEVGIPIFKLYNESETTIRNEKYPSKNLL